MTPAPPYPQRHALRLPNYDYGQAGAYFITVCAHQRACLFGEIVDGVMHENHAGHAVREAWESLPKRFPDLECDAFVVTPSHIHGILVVGDGQEHEHLSRVVGAFKSLTIHRYSRGVSNEAWPRYEGSLWQRNYYEHVIRSETALNQIREYIAGNPQQWADDPENPLSRKQQ